jgi:hypothetical protein
MAPRARGTARLLLAFATGGAVILAAVRYMPAFKDAVVGNRPAASTAERAASREMPRSAVAGRLSYELSAPTDSRDAISEPRVSPAPATAARAAEQAPAADVVPGEYVANVRPITAAPPDPRDRTPAIQKESRAAESIHANPKQPDVEGTP